MKAVFMRSHGNFDVVEYGDLSTPQSGSGEVQVKVQAAALNRLDLWVREGWPGLKLTFPHVFGTDAAGVISSQGEGSSTFAIGDRVAIYPVIYCGNCPYCLAGKQNLCGKWHLLGETISGTFAEYITVPSQNLISLPEHISFPEAAAAGLVYLTAWHSLITRGGLQRGESLLVIGASGGVNTASIQLAKYIGAKVYVLGSSPSKLDFAATMGADVLIDRSTEKDWAKAVYTHTGKKGVDVVVDNVGAATMSQSLKCVRKGGRVLTVGNTSGPHLEIDNRFIFWKHLSLIGSSVGTLDDYKTVMNLVFEGKLKPVLDHQYPLENIAEAMGRLESGQQMGKIIVTP